MGSHIDYGLLQEENRRLGTLGEQLVVAFERQQLREGGHAELADRVRWVARDDGGDGLGYDVPSFDADGCERHIEVKTTALGAHTPFYISAAELQSARCHPRTFALHRVYDVLDNPRLLRPERRHRYSGRPRSHGVPHSSGRNTNLAAIKSLAVDGTDKQTDSPEAGNMIDSAPWASEWVASVSGVVGAAVGAGATLTGNWITSHAQVKLAAEDREQKRAEVRREACAEYLFAVDSFMDQARELVARLESNAPESELDSARGTYSKDWDDLQRKCAPVVIAGPPELGERAQGLKGQLGALADVCDSWYTARKNGPTRSRDGKFVSARDAVREVRAAFVSAAQKYALSGTSEPVNRFRPH